MRGDLGALCEGATVWRLVQSGEVWTVDQDGGSLLELVTYQVLREWAVDRDRRLVWIGNDRFELGLVGCVVDGAPVARVAVVRGFGRPPEQEDADLPAVVSSRR